MKKKKMKAIVVTGGVLSGLGKGVFGASIASLLQKNYKFVCIKCDGYLNADPGTMNPIEHGEVYVLDDGGEVDMDFGHYERFAHISAKKDWNITMGKIYKQILENERQGKFLGKTVQLIPHATDEIKDQIYKVFEKEDADIALIEIGGTIGDMENELFIESMRQLRRDLGPQNIMFFHLTYVPFVFGSREFKSKPTQASVKALNRSGIYPDAIVCRCEKEINEEIKSKISLYCNVPPEAVFNNVDLQNVYYLPLSFQQQGMLKLIEKHLNVRSDGMDKKDELFVHSLQELRKKSSRPPHQLINIAICGKYTHLEDSYVSIREALLHSQVGLYSQKKKELDYNLIFVNSEEITAKNVAEQLKDIDCIIIPGGFGSRGLEGKVLITNYAREKDIPLLGICLGMQIMVVEYARYVCQLKRATSEEIINSDDTLSKDDDWDLVISLLPSQKKVDQKGGTMRLGSHPVHLKKDSCLNKLFGQEVVHQKFRHRYEVNPQYVSLIESKGLLFSGATDKNDIKLMCECQEKTFFVGTQSHPELSSTPTAPSPFFTALLEKTLQQKSDRFSKK